MSRVRRVLERTPPVDQQASSRRAIEQQPNELEALYAIVRAVASDLELSTTLQTICQAVCSYSSWEMCDIVVVNQATGMAELVARDATRDTVPSTAPWPLSVSPTLRAIQLKKPLVEKLTPWNAQVGFTYALVVPLIVDEPAACIWFYTSSSELVSEREIVQAQGLICHTALPFQSRLLRRNCAPVQCPQSISPVGTACA
jgi:hypothetical protein